MALAPPAVPVALLLPVANGNTRIVEGVAVDALAAEADVAVTIGAVLGLVAEGDALPVHPKSVASIAIDARDVTILCIAFVPLVRIAWWRVDQRGLSWRLTSRARAKNGLETIPGDTFCCAVSVSKFSWRCKQGQGANVMGCVCVRSSPSSRFLVGRLSGDLRVDRGGTRGITAAFRHMIPKRSTTSEERE